MGREVQYSPFSWQNQSTAHNRLLKFLVFIIFLSLLSFYIGYPDPKNETPRKESAPYRVNYVVDEGVSEATKRYEEPSTEAAEVPSFTEQSIEEKAIINHKQYAVFDNSVVPSGPNLNPEEKLKLLEEEERKIIESQEEVEKESTTLEVSDVGVGESFNENQENKREEDFVEEETTQNPNGSTNENNEETTTEGGEITTIGIEEAEKQILEVTGNLTSFDENITSNNETTIETDVTNSTETGNSNQENEQTLFENLSDCHAEEWNNVTIEEVPHQSVFKQWISQNSESSVNGSTNLPKFLGAFAYKTHIAVTLSERNFTSETVYCRYYDCHKKQLARQMVSFVFPESTVYCPRRAGAKFISISQNLEEKPEYPVQILKRIVPHHFFTVCVSMDSNEENILRIARFIEYYKLQGSSFFHVYLKNSSHYQRMLLDDYVRTGDVKIIKIEENVTGEIQANDCQHRTKYFSKWTTFLNLEDQLKTEKETETISSYLDSITDQNTTILKWSSSENNETVRLLIRPEKIVSINHSPIMVYSGNQLDENTGPSGFLLNFSNSSELTPENFSENVADDVSFREELIENVISRTKYVFSTIETDNQKNNEKRTEEESETTTEPIIIN